jgi:hypothetical protein
MNLIAPQPFYRTLFQMAQSRVNFPPEGEKTEVFSGPKRAFPKSGRASLKTLKGRVSLKTRKGLVTSAQRVPAQRVPAQRVPAQRVPAQTKKKKNWDNFMGANLKVCHPDFGPFLNLGRPWTSPSRVLKEVRPLRVFKEARPDFEPFGTECGRAS